MGTSCASYGALIVLDDNEGFEDERDQLIVADDWLLDKNDQINTESLGNGHWSHWAFLDRS